MRLELPWPPSINHYWRHRIAFSKQRDPRTGKRKQFIQTYISPEGRAYRSAVEAQLVGETTDTFEGPVRLGVLLRPPDRRLRDLDNCCKALLDALQHSRVFADDNQIWELSARWDLGETGHVIVQPGGLAIVTIEPLEAAPVLFDRNEQNAGPL